MSLGRGCGCSQGTWIYCISLPDDLNPKLKVQWCMTLFNSLDNALMDLIASTLPRLCRQEARMEVVEENVEIMVT